jgi:PKD repeat protein
VSGDLDPKTGLFTATFDAAGAPPRDQTPCGNPALLIDPGVCPMGNPPVGPFRFDFGDGSSASFPAQSQARAAFAPFVHHDYAHPGVFRVTLTVSSAGSDDTMTLPIAVHPALRVRVARRGVVYRAHVSGGDGHVVVLAWRMADGTVVHAGSVAAARHPRSVSAVDGTGTRATARL